ncbi:MAG TPA: xanthine dehydrogenase family protein molybdopterin-binding subunit, partial [Aigarchaeota archaeon]|nr:xanthine dehydrogenase family protein molybdopterin-binding subunit [Aigarchaeota archaeon]
MMQTQYVGSPVKRKEDPRLIKGESTYLDDIKLPGMLYAAFLRSSYPHAKIKRIDVSQALTLEGVVAVYTGKDLKDAVGPLVVESINRGSKVPSHYPLAVDEVKFVGEPVAVVVAEDR